MKSINAISGLLILVCSYAKTARADDPINGYVGVSGAYMFQMSNVEKGSRLGAQIEFARLNRWVAVHARFLSGMGYQDYGGLLRVYKHFALNTAAATGFSVGAGAGAVYSSGIKKGASVSSGNADRRRS